MVIASEQFNKSRLHVIEFIYYPHWLTITYRIEVRTNTRDAVAPLMRKQSFYIYYNNNTCVRIEQFIASIYAGLLFCPKYTQK